MARPCRRRPCQRLMKLPELSMMLMQACMGSGMRWPTPFGRRRPGLLQCEIWTRRSISSFKWSFATLRRESVCGSGRGRKSSSAIWDSRLEWRDLKASMCACRLMGPPGFSVYPAVTSPAAPAIAASPARHGKLNARGVGSATRIRHGGETPAILCLKQQACSMPPC